MAYGVATNNVFALLDDENEDPQVLAATKVTKVAPKKEAPKEEPKPAAAKPSAPHGGRGEGGRGRGEHRQDGAGELRGRGGRGRGEGKGRGRGRGDYQYDRPRYDQERSFQGEGGNAEVAEGGFGGGFNSEGAGGENGGRGGYNGYRGRGRGRGRRGDGEYFNRPDGEERGVGRRDGGVEGQAEGANVDYRERRPRRQFDRHDGTGRGHEAPKRGGAGKGNWGSDADAVAVNAEVAEAVAEEKPEQPVAADADFAGGFDGAAVATEDAPKAEAGAEPAAAEDAVPTEEEAIEMTLDEYEVILAEKKAQLNKQSESAEVDLTQFKGMAAYKRKEEDEESMGLVLRNKKEAKAAKEKARKEIVTLETGFKVQSADELGGRGRGGRGGRGRGRADRPEGNEARGGGGGGGRGFRSYPPEESSYASARGRGRGRGTGPAPLIDDETSFPSLG